ncbi:hypothetical protein [Enterococcus faecalis]|uniref:hypothetical protein n=1 Tax=Enterococcus TaxID=1350 RepID=UPI00070FC54E|nr:hypothetical protein [Enterococcus faecalis]KXF71693.1 hypothetical protein AQ486_03680 [Enterococcus faecalis]KXF72654.1 hypothetical protein AQ487_11865 [Enterococcus faecalis]MBC2812557.1 hypothetical protein [Enterococcus faecalis]MBC2816457.1 hypothetical protein [Enterococcus faecalis]MBC2819524.1 hypothetical protein [Enterococcus faecalis]
MFYFTLLLLEPKRDQEKISREKISIDELKQFSKYLEEQTTKGIPVKARISIYEEETKKGSIALSTNRDGTDVLEILLARVSQPEILRYLAENRGKQSSLPTSSKGIVDAQKEEPEQSFQEDQEVYHTKDLIESEPISEEEHHELSGQNTRKNTKKSTKTLSKQISTPRVSTTEWKNKSILILAGLVVLLFLLNGFLFWRQSTLANKLEVWQIKAEKAVTLVEKQPKIDTTSRFFLASYFSQAKEAPYKEGLKKFAGTSVEKWERPLGELNSMFLYEINEEKKGTEVNYILTISEEKTTKIKKISFYMKEKEGTILVVSQPKIEDFSW